MREGTATGPDCGDTMASNRIIVITGPTATGKSALGVLLAKNIDGEIVSADSMQVYKHMDIGAAKPSNSARAAVPHHMLDVVPPTEDYSAARYVREASACIDDIIERGKTPVIVGGTGLYIDSLISGQGFSARGDDALRRALEAEYDERGGEAMLKYLRAFDPGSAAKLHENDKKRIVRAIEVFKATGKTISAHDSETKRRPPRYEAAKFALTFADRAELYERIDRRVDRMLADGFENEVRGLLGMGVAHGNTAMQAIGYKEIAEAILSGSDLAGAVERVKQESRRYAKRQLTWLRRDPAVRWIVRDSEPDLEADLEAAVLFIMQHRLPEAE